jgi:hypothetical protein
MRTVSATVVDGGVAADQMLPIKALAHERCSLVREQVNRRLRN